MRVLLLGAGTVGEAIARVAAGRDWLEQMVVADYDAARAALVTGAAQRAADGAGRSDQFESAQIDASSQESVTELARSKNVDLVMNALDPQFVMPIFNGAFAADVNYMDMAMSLSQPHEPAPYEKPGVKLGDEQFAKSAEWESRGRLALVGMGMDPGLTDVFAAYAAKHLFKQVTEVHVRDGGDLAIPDFPFAPVFSIWTKIEECLNPPVLWANGEWRTTEPFSAPEMFPFPDGVGPVECVNVEHEEVLLVPRWIKARNVTFKYALGSEFIEKLRTIHALGMDRKDRVVVRGTDVAPRDVLAAITPDPAKLGDRMTGRAIVGTWVIGRHGNGSPREVYLYQTTDAQDTWGRLGLGAVAWQTGFNPVIAMELLASGAWSGAGVLGPEALDPDPYLGALDTYGIHHAVVEMEPGRHRPT